MKKITIAVTGDTESDLGADRLRQALRNLARELSEPGMVGGMQEIGGLTISWTVEVGDLPEAVHVHDFVNAEDYTGNAFCECGEQQ